MRLFADRSLSLRLERAEGCAGASYIEARAKLAPCCGAEWRDFDGTSAMFESPDSPATQTFGLGMNGPVTPAGLDRLEAFFLERGAPVNHEVSPLADASVWPLLAERRYVPIEFTSLLFMELETGNLPEYQDTSDIRVRIPRASEADVWTRTAVRAWTEDHPELSEVLTPVMQNIFHTVGAIPFIAEKHDEPVATGALNIQNGVALLAGAGTVPEARRQGAQRALLATRLRFALEAGCDLATMGAQPGSASQRNAERSGFRIAYSRTKWSLSHRAV